MIKYLCKIYYYKTLTEFQYLTHEFNSVIIYIIDISTYINYKDFETVKNDKIFFLWQLK